MNGPIASAVVLPEQDLDTSPPAVPSPNGQKRRQSSISEQDAKRPRLNGNDTSNDRRNSIGNGQPVAPVPKGRERGRERRLFGAALGALSHNPATAAQKRRSEIEKRQQAQRRHEEEESEQRKLERQARLKAQRWKEQKRFDKDYIRIRHDNLLATAHFLQTASEPRLYYRPWETTEDEDERIRDQIAAAHSIIRREREDDENYQERTRDRNASHEGHADRNANNAQPGKESNAETPLEPPAANDGPTDGSDPFTKDPELNGDHAEGLANEEASEERTALETQRNNGTSHEAAADEATKEAVDENGEEIVEAAEDTVIY